MSEQQEEQQNPQVGGPEVGGQSAGVGFLWFLIGAAVAGGTVWYVMRQTGVPQTYSPIKNLATGDIACLPEAATGEFFGGGSA